MNLRNWNCCDLNHFPSLPPYERYRYCKSTDRQKDSPQIICTNRQKWTEREKQIKAGEKQRRRKRRKERNQPARESFRSLKGFED